MVITGSLFLKIFSVIIAIVSVIFVWFKKRYSYWKDLGLPYVEPTIPCGNMGDVFYQKLSSGESIANFYHQMKMKKIRHAGYYFFHLPIYIPLDLDLTKHIMQNDFAHFTDRMTYVNEKSDPLSAHIFSLAGQRWRDLRVKLTPTFTSGKMKMMYPIMVKISQELITNLERECQNGPIDVKDISARFTTDVIGNCAFGVNCNSLADPNTEFRVYGKRILALTTFESALNFFAVTLPKVAKFFRVRFFPKEGSDFFWNVIKNTTEYRIKNGVRRNDALQLLLDMMSKDGEESADSLTFSELAAQAFVFFLAGFETSSTLMSFALLELSLAEDVQDKLRAEVKTVLERHNGELSYEAIQEMHYLEMVINETLRKYPPLPTLTRECTKDYRIPDSDIVLPKGIGVFIPIKGIHYDPEYYPEPEKFDPTRFTEENKSKRHNFAFLPFGEGPRICLGLRFGLMQAKVGLASLVKDFRFKINPRTQLPVKLNPKNFLTAALEGLWVDAEKIN